MGWREGIGKEDRTDMDSIVREQQVEVGRVEFRKLDMHVYIASENWPSWAFAIAGYTFNSVTVNVKHHLLSSMIEVKELINSNWLSSTHLGPWLKSIVNESKLILIQGSRSFLNDTLRDVTDHTSLPLIYVCTNTTFRSKDTFLLSHEACGGVTSGAWPVYASNIKLFMAQAQTTVRRRFSGQCTRSRQRICFERNIDGTSGW